MGNEKETKSEVQVELSHNSKSINITTPSGKKFNLVVNDETIEVFASNGFGSGLVVRPCANNSISIGQVKD